MTSSSSEIGMTALALPLLLFAPAAVLWAQKPVLPLPLTAGTVIVQTLDFPGGDRESVLEVRESSPVGLLFNWRFVEVHASGDTLRSSLEYLERAADVADAFRILIFHDANGPKEHPGYTMHALSRAVYRRLRATGADSFQVMGIISRGGGLAALGFGVTREVPVRWRGTLTRVTPQPVPFPLLLNGRRIEVPVLRLRGRFTSREKVYEPDIWVLADSLYPFVLKWIGHYNEPGNVLQTIRVDLKDPVADDLALEKAITSTCRAELPGIYFSFNSAVLDSASHRAITSVAAILSRHPDWKVTLEGHTDSIGSAASNRTLSERRVNAVKDRLVSAHRIDAARLLTAGLGSARPREANSTVEGRARNRRVELVRDCARP
jgi:outer membrane protein OmpA-like peptidoglycan-associated protein